MPSASEIMNKYYEGKDFPAPEVVTVEDVSVETLKSLRDQSDVDKLIVQLEGHRRKVVLNKTTCKALIEEWGDDYSQWVGNRMTLVGVPMMVMGKQMLVLIGKPMAVVSDKQVG